MTNKTNREYTISIVIIAALFFIFGFVTWLNATLIPYLKIACELKNDFQAYLVAFSFYISYFFMALPSSWLLNKTGFKNGMSLGLAVMAAGALIFIPSAISRTFSLFLTGLFIQGTGLSILQTAVNPYVTIIGPIESAAKRISIMGICNKIAGIISPAILGFIVLQGIDDISANLKTMDALQKSAELNLLASKVILPYIIMAVILTALAIMIRFSPLPEISESQSDSEKKNSEKSIFKFKYLWFGIIAIFVYVGAEVISVDSQILYGKWLGFGISQAKFFSSVTLTAMIIGYITGIILIPKYLKQEVALKYFSILGIIFSISAIFTSGFTSVLFIALLGFANSIMWPAIWPLAIVGLGRHTKIASALLIMGILGGALLPLLYGYLSEIVGNRSAYWILVPCYIYILFFSTIGHKSGREN